MFIVIFGGMGVILVVLFMFMWMMKFKRNKVIGCVLVVLIFFGVNELILFGVLLVLNFVFFILFVLVLIVNVWIFKFFVEVLGMNSFSVNLFWIILGLLGIIMGIGFGLWLFVLVIILIVVDIIIYYLFLKVYDSEIFDEEEGCKESNLDLKEKVVVNFDMKKVDLILVVSGVLDDVVKVLNIIE